MFSNRDGALRRASCCVDPMFDDSRLQIEEWDRLVKAGHVFVAWDVAMDGRVRPAHGGRGEYADGT
jgi:hypothetical protein